MVLGASLKPNRYSNLAIHRLVANNIPTSAYGLKTGSVSGVSIENQLVNYKDIHTITLYLNPKRQEAFYDYILALKPKRIIFNPGTENPILISLLEKHQIMHEIACTLTLLATQQF